MRTVEIIISPKGEAIIQAKGFQGSACQAASRFIEQSLGQRAAETLTAEFYQTPAVEQTQRQHS
jgi:hypothetical protein